MPCRLLSPLVACVLLVASFAAHPRRAEAAGPRWPQFRGPTRDGISSETGLLQTWPEGGPKQVWQVGGLGKGYSSPIIVDGMLYITGDVGDDLVIFAFDLDGKLKWKAKNGRSWKKSWPGCRASCTWDDGRLYHMNAHGRVVCLAPETGAMNWTVNVFERFDAPNIRWGISECLLIDGDHVIVTPGGKKALMAALDKRTGQTVWASEPLHFTRTHRFGNKKTDPIDPPEPDVDKAGYASPSLLEVGGRRLILGCSARHLFCVDAEDGSILWKKGVYVRWEVIASMPAICGSSVFFTVPDEFGGMLWHVKADADSVTFEPAWQTSLDSCHGAMTLVDGRLYGAGHKKSKEWGCIEVATGKMLYSRGDLAKGCSAYADGRLYVLSEKGIVELIKPTDTGFETKGRFRLVQPKQSDVWPHPVICGGRLYLRYHDTLRCYDIRR